MTDALTAAAKLLIDAAPPATVRAILRLLLDDDVPPVQPPAQLIVQPPAAPSPMPRRRRERDVDWPDTVKRLKATIAERGATLRDVAQAAGCQAATISRALRGVSANQTTQQRLREWLDRPVPEVADTPAPFRRRGRTNGAAPVTTA
jgi:hypothetical protein